MFQPSIYQNWKRSLRFGPSFTQLKRSLGKGALLCLLLTFAGCSQIRLGLDWVDTYISWQLDKELDLASQQEDVIEKNIDRFLDGHKLKYAERIGNFFKEVADQFWLHKDSPEELGKLLDQYLNQMAKFLSELAQDAKPSILESAKHIKVSNWKNYRESYAKATKERRLRKSQLEDRFEDWIPLKKAQRELIKQFLQENPFNRDLWERNRKSAFKSFEDQFYQGEEFDQEKFIQALEKLLDSPRSHQDPEFSAYIDDRREKTKQLTLEILKTLDESQKEKLHQRLLERSEDFLGYVRKKSPMQTQPQK